MTLYEWKGCEIEQMCPDVCHHRGICLKRLGKKWASVAVVIFPTRIQTVHLQNAHHKH